jgi:phosphatidylinositol glycan class F
MYAICRLVAHTFLLGLLIASFSTLLGAMLFGSHLNEYLEVVLTLRCRSIHEKYVAFTTIGSTLGAYFGALPIPLDWDRPWQVRINVIYGCM